MISAVIPAELDPSFWGGYIDSPTVNSDINMNSIRVSGWIIRHDEKLLTIVATWQGLQIANAPANLPRPDVSAAFPYIPNATNSGYSFDIQLLGLPTDFELFLYADVNDEQRYPVGRISGSHHLIQPTFRPKQNPLMVTAPMGRTGSTWLMRVLSEHPEIVVHKQYPYETTYLTYWMHALTILSAQGDLSKGNGIGRDRVIYPNPFIAPGYITDRNLQKWLSEDFISDLAAFSQQNIETFYGYVAQSQNQYAPKYFAEKMANPFPLMVWQLYPQAAEIFYIRDLRDQLCSVLAFNAKRGYLSFEYDRYTSDRDYIEFLDRLVRNWLISWKIRQDKSILVHYETLIQSPHDSFARILEYLKLDNSLTIIDKMLQKAAEYTPEMAFHRTSKDVASSIGRWRYDLSDNMQALCDELLGDLLEDLGYSR